MEKCKKENVNLDEILNSINKWENAHLLVIGDTIVDQYAACEALGMSAEAPVLVVKELRTKNFNGGAAIVASHVKALGANCVFLSVIGNDENGQDLLKILKKEKLRTDGIIIDKKRKTTVKKRVIVKNNHIVRIDDEIIIGMGAGSITKWMREINF